MFLGVVVLISYLLYTDVPTWAEIVWYKEFCYGIYKTHAISSLASPFNHEPS